jgi:hypothetical protein
LTKPNFFIVGAPKCGTTAMDEYLKQHPDIFMAKKELHYFGSDLQMKNRIAESGYLQHFENISGKKIIGDSSVWYLYSKKAAQEIKRLSPDAKVLIMLRNPVHMLQSLHSQNIYDGNENISDFETAINLDEERKKGNNQPKCVDFIALPPYKEVALFYEQVKRYITVFGKEKVHIIIFEEFAKDTERSTKSVFEFLDLDTDVPIEYNIINPNKKIQFLFLNQLIKTPATWLKQVIRILIPVKKIRHRIMSSLQERNIKVKEREKINPELEKKLKPYFANDITALSSLINKDISTWL